MEQRRQVSLLGLAVRRDLISPETLGQVALKFLARDEPDKILRFILEAQHQAKVDHPNICKVYEVRLL